MIKSILYTSKPCPLEIEFIFFGNEIEYHNIQLIIDDVTLKNTPEELQDHLADVFCDEWSKEIKEQIEYIPKCY